MVLDKTTFRPLTVEVEELDADIAIVRGALATGKWVVSDGTFALKSEYLR